MGHKVAKAETLSGKSNWKMSWWKPMHSVYVLLIMKMSPKDGKGHFAKNNFSRSMLHFVEYIYSFLQNCEALRYVATILSFGIRWFVFTKWKLERL